MSRDLMTQLKVAQLKSQYHQDGKRRESANEGIKSNQRCFRVKKTE